MLNIFLDRFRQTMSHLTPGFFSSLTNEQLYEFLKSNDKYHSLNKYTGECNFRTEYKGVQMGTGDFDFTYVPMSISLYSSEKPDFSFNIDLYGGEYKCELYWGWDESMQFLYMLSQNKLPTSIALKSNSVVFNLEDKYVALYDYDLRTVTESDFIDLLDLVVSYIITSFAIVEYTENRGLIYA